MSFDGALTHGAWRLKQYTIAAQGGADQRAFAVALPFAFEALPAPAVDALRPGVGFLIRHEGAGARYLVLCWWDNENELPMRLWVQPTDGSSCWRRAGERESVCVWDLQIIEGERRAFIEHVLDRAGTPDIDAYLASDATRVASRV